MSKKISDDIFLTEERLKARIRYRRYYDKHRTEINERRKQRYAANPEKYKECARKYYACLDSEQKKSITNPERKLVMHGTRKIV